MPKPAIAQLHIRTPRIFIRIGNADFRALSPAPLEHAQNIAGLRDFPAAERIQMRKHAFESRQIPATAADNCSAAARSRRPNSFLQNARLYTEIPPLL